MDQTDPWQVVPRQVFTPYDSLLISVAFVVLRRVDCLGITDMLKKELYDMRKIICSRKSEVPVEKKNQFVMFIYSKFHDKYIYIHI